MRVSANIIVEDEVKGELKQTPYGFDLNYVKDYQISDLHPKATFVTFYDDFSVHVSMPFGEFNAIMNPVHRFFHKVDLDEG